MKMQRSKTDACHLWALFCEGKLCGWVRKASAQAVGFIDSVPTQLLCGARNNSSMSRKPEAGDFMARPTFWSPAFEVLFFPVLARAKAIEETCGAACHHVARFLHALACYIATQQFHEARSLLTAGCAFCAPCVSAYRGNLGTFTPTKDTCRDGSALDILKLH